MTATKRTQRLMSVVTTISGNQIERRNCISIRKEGASYYHEKNVDCFEIGERWVSKHFNNIEYDYYTKQYNWKSRMSPVIIDIDIKAKKCIFGNASSSFPTEVYSFESDGPVYCLDKEVYDKVKNHISECRYTGKEYLFGKSKHKTFLDFDVNRHLYNNVVSAKKAIVDRLTMNDKIEYGIDSITFSQTGGIRNTFGVEIECSDGYLSYDEANAKNLNISCDKDGSLVSSKGNKYGGGEYVTGVLKGDAGLNHLKKIVDILERRTKQNDTCSIHTHIGIGESTEDYVVYAYLLGILSENSISALFPKHRKITVNEYCKRLQPLDVMKYSKIKALNSELSDSDCYTQFIKYNYQLIFKWLSGGSLPSKTLNRLSDHPKGFKCGFDHHTPRYCWLNLIPTAFNIRKNKSWTIELRIHTATHNFTKIKNWVLFSLAFENMIRNHSRFIYDCFEKGKEITFEDIIVKTYSTNTKLGRDLLDYFSARYAMFSNLNTDKKEEDLKCV